MTTKKSKSKPDSAAAAAAQAFAGMEAFKGPGGESAQQIWLAGMGAFSKAQQEGGKVFDALVKEGVALQRKTQAAAQERLDDVARKIKQVATQATGDATGKAGQPWDRLETIFEERVARSLAKLGMPSAKAVQALAERVQALEDEVARLSSTGRKNKEPVAASGQAPSAKRPGTPAAKSTGKKRPERN